MGLAPDRCSTLELLTRSHRCAHFREPERDAPSGPNGNEQRQTTTLRLRGHSRTLAHASGLSADRIEPPPAVAHCGRWG
jgi:hypothetical protein